MAFKENSIKMTMDIIEKELKEISFSCDVLVEKRTKIIKDYDVVLHRFEDLLIKVQNLKGN